MLLIAVLAGCSSTPTGKPAAVTENRAAMPSTAAPLAGQAAATPAQLQQEDRLRAMLVAGNLREAKVQLQSLAPARPDSLFLQLNLAIALDKSEQTEAAIAQYQKVLSRWPGQADAANNLAMHYRAQGKIVEARDLLESGLRTQHDDATLHYNLAALNELYFLDFSSAITHYKAYQARQGKPDEKIAAWIKDLERRVAK